MKVDVILPIYNPGQWVFEAIDSVINQTYHDWNLFIIDDCTPSPGEIISQIKSIAGNNGKITYTRLEKNRRAAAARNFAVANSCGDAIAFLDQDDIWYPEKLALQVERFNREPLVHVVHTNIIIVDENGNECAGASGEENKLRDSIAYQNLDYRELAAQFCSCNSIRLVSVIILREAYEAIGGWDESLFGGEDWEIWVRLAASKYRFDHLSKPLAYRRVHSTNTSLVFSVERLRGHLAAVDKVEKAYPFLNKAVRMRKIERYHAAIPSELKAKQFMKAMQCACSLFQLKPLSAKSVALLIIACLGPLGLIIMSVYWRQRAKD